MNKFNFKNISSGSQKNPNIKIVQHSVDDKVTIAGEDGGSGHFKRLDFADIYLPAYYSSRIFGLMPFSIDYDKNGTVQGPKVRIRDFLWFIIALCLYICFVIRIGRNMGNSFVSGQPDSTIHLTTVGTDLLLILGLIVGAITICMHFYNRFKFVGILKSFNSFDEEVSHWNILALKYNG